MIDAFTARCNYDKFLKQQQQEQHDLYKPIAEIIKEASCKAGSVKITKQAFDELGLDIYNTKEYLQQLRFQTGLDISTTYPLLIQALLVSW
jgi:hypothetical protein